MKPSERIEQIASKRYVNSAYFGRVYLTGGSSYGPADPRAILDYLDELHAENEALRERVSALETEP